MCRSLMEIEVARGIASGDIDPLTGLPIVDLNPESTSNHLVRPSSFANVFLLIASPTGQVNVLLRQTNKEESTLPGERRLESPQLLQQSTRRFHLDRSTICCHSHHRYHAAKGRSSRQSAQVQILRREDRGGSGCEWERKAGGCD